MGWNPLKSFAKGVGNVVKKGASALSLVNPALGIGAASVGSFFGSDESVDAQRDINDQNLDLQRAMNQQNQANWTAQFDWTKSEASRAQANWEQEMAFARENADYQKQQNLLTQQREDTAIQRQVADAESAGLSPLAVAGSGGASSSLVSAPSNFSGASSPVAAPSAPEMRAPYLQAPVFQADLQAQQALLQFASQAVLQDRNLSSNEKVVKMQTSTQKFITVSQLETSKSIADASNSKDLQIATNQLLELNRSNTAKEYQAKLDYFQKTVSQITDGHGRFEYGKHDVETCRAHNEEISTRWAEFIRTLPADSLSKSQSDNTSVSGGLKVGKNDGGSSSRWNPLAGVANSLTKGLNVGVDGSYSKGKSDADSIGQSSSVRALIKSFWLRNENVLWIPKGGF